MSIVNAGHVFWITGLSGSGKTTLAKELVFALKHVDKPTVLLDGDEVREALDNVFGYAPEERKKAAFSYSKLAKLIASQGVNVVVATISMFHEVRQWNVDNIQNYIEIYLKSDRFLLEKRDSKGLYARASDGDECVVVGHCQEFEEPIRPDLTFVASNSLSLKETVQTILNNLKD